MSSYSHVFSLFYIRCDWACTCRCWPMSLYQPEDSRAFPILHINQPSICTSHRMFWAAFVFSTLATALVAHAQSVISTFPPGTPVHTRLPLIVRSPYFSLWTGGDQKYDEAVSPLFWDTSVCASFFTSTHRQGYNHEFDRLLGGAV